jgi:tetratricopeptide (TPR) repeat protein/ferredoxin
VIAAHIAHWLATGSTVTPVEPSEAMAFSKAGIVNAGLIFFAATILLTAIFGRWFCGWACHLVALQDGSLWLLKKLGIRPKPLRSRLLRWVPAFAFLYMFVWPAAYRLWRGDTLGVRGSELTTSHFWETFPGWVVGALTFLICGFVAVYFLGAKGFCTYACPYGAAFSWVDRLAPMRVRVTDACQGCGHCTAVCTSNVRVHEEVRDYRMVVDPGCMKCGDCVSVCPNDALYIGFGKLPLFARRRPGPEPEARRYPLAWSEEILVALVFVATFFVYRGLYGYLPFLMTLGLAGCLAFLALLGWRLLRRRSFAFRHRELKRGGRLLPAGRWLGAGLAALFLITLHAAIVHADVALGERQYARLAGLRARTLDLSIAADSPALRPGPAEDAALARAAARFERAARWSPVDWLGLDARLAWTRRLRGDAAGFEEASRRALQRGDSTEEMLVLRATGAAARGDAAGAAAALEALPERQAGDTAWAALAGHAGRAGGLTTAAALLERGLLHYPGSAPLLYNSAVVAALRNQPEIAAEGFRQVLAIDPDHREARENLAGMLASLGRWDEAVALYREAIASAPGDADLVVLLARALLEKGDREGALAAAERALELSPANEAALALRTGLVD